MAKVVNPTNTTHQFDFQPRFSPIIALELYLKNEATNIETLVANTHEVLKNELLKITFDFTFQERNKFQIKIMEGTEVIYRGKLFATVQETQDFKITEGFITY